MNTIRILLSAVGVLAALATACGGETTSDENTTSADNALAAAFVPPPAYAEGKLHSDLTPEIISKLKAIHALLAGDEHTTHSDNAFIKVGDSITFSKDFLDCLATTPVTGANADLEGTRTFFEPESWARQSTASTIGWHTWQPYTGTPSPLDNEIGTMHPAFAVVMLGTNDAYVGTNPSYELHLSTLVKILTDKGIIPILSTIPPLRNTTQNAAVPGMNLIVRKVASAASIPLMDFHQTLLPLHNWGLSGDGIHPFAAQTGACDFSDSAMIAGYNQRNLLALQALDRVRHAVLDEDP